VIIDPVGLRPKFKIGELVRCVSTSGDLLAGAWISYGHIGIVKKIQFFKRVRATDGEKEESRPYPSIICEVEVFWMEKNESAWVLESLLQPLEI
jgi:hypothetical protein